MDSSEKANLAGLKVVSFESRRAKEIAELVRRYGGEPITAPAMREIPLSENHAALEILPQLEAGQFDLLILMTGVGTRTLNELLLTKHSQEKIVAALRKTRLVTRGPKPVAALKELGLQPDITVPEPNTWREVLATIGQAVDLQGKRVALQEYGIPNPELVAGLQRRGASVETFAIYKWALPEDIDPLRAAIKKISNGEVGVALFTNGAQVDHLFQVAIEDGSEEELRRALKKIVVGSVGPVCTEVLQQFGIEPDIVPEHPKMGSLIAAVAASARDMLTRKVSR
ncbi:MAG TPA: uroporphyrinogen-III synthase [Candidatus Binatia bacterium]|nr:uroporphyrinogen-III synthase [Candidatus Binatia bacterium]